MMSRKPRKELGAAQVAALWRRGSTHVGGVRGLILNVTKYGSRSWVLRYQVAGKRRDLGLGSYPSVSLADAREVLASLLETAPPATKLQAIRLIFEINKATPPAQDAASSYEEFMKHFGQGLTHASQPKHHH